MVELLYKRIQNDVVTQSRQAGHQHCAANESLPYAVAAVSLVCLAILGGVAAQVGGAPVVPGARRVMCWGALAMAVTSGVGALFGTQM